MDANFEHVGYRYRPPASLTSGNEWHYAKASEADDMETLAEKDWRVERLHRRCEDASE